MAGETQGDRAHLAPVIILHRPQGPINIGLVARAVANFSLGELRLVAPEPWRSLDSWAWRMASGSRHILAAAREFETLREAVADLRYLIGTSARVRASGHPEISLPELRRDVPWERGQPVGFLFGPEDCGLTKEELETCDAIVAIPTAGPLRSLNLSHAVAIVGHALHPVPVPPPQESVLASRQELETLIDAWGQGLEAIHYFRRTPREEFVSRLREVFHGGRLSQRDVLLLRGIAAQMEYFARQQGGDGL